jgi:hypothetical protein
MGILTPLTEENKDRLEDTVTHPISNQEMIRLSQIFEDLQKIDDFLQDEVKERSKTNASEPDETLQESDSEEDESCEKELSKSDICSLFFGLSDTFVEYLCNSERYGLLHQDNIKAFLNEQDHWIVLFHYILGKFPEPYGVTSIFLNYDLRRSLEESPFTEEIHVLIKCQLILVIYFFCLNKQHNLTHEELRTL